MPTTPFILIFGLLVATCVIAYWADNLGKKLGKKRISLFGLRPRQSATLISMASSVGIMLFTLFVLLAFSGSVRNALLYYDTVRADLNRAEKQNAAAARDIEALNRDRAATAAQVAQVKRDLQAARAQVEKTRRLIRGAQSQLQSTQQRLGEVRRRLGAAEKTRDAARNAEKRARAAAAQAHRSETQARKAEKEAGARLRLVQNRYARAQELSAQAHRSLARARRELQQKTQSLQKVNQRLNEKNAELQKVQQSLRFTADKLASSESDLAVTERDLSATQKYFVATQKQLNAQKIEVDRLRGEQTALQQQIDQLNSAITEALQQISFANRILTEPIVIERDTVFAASTLPSRLTMAQARVALRDLARRARATLENAKTPRQLEIVLADENARIVLDEEAVIEQLASYLTQLPLPVSVRLVAARDHIAADSTVIGRFLVVPVRTIYRRGEVIAESVIDGHQSDALIFRGLLRLTDEGATEARRRGAVPLVTSRDEPFYAEGTNERIFAALRRIGALDRPVPVRLVAAADVSTAEPVRVRFEIGDETESSAGD